MSTLKSENSAYITAFLGFNAIVLYALSSETATLSGIIAAFTDNPIEKGLLSVLVCLFGGILNALLDRETKSRFVFWQWKNPQPASRAFSVYGPADNRVDMSVLQNKNGPLPLDANAQNKLWYKIFKKHETSANVSWAHKQWLLTRDLTALSIIFAVGSAVAHLLMKSASELIYMHMLILLSEYLLCMGAARTHGINFVTNALAQESV